MLIAIERDSVFDDINNLFPSTENIMALCRQLSVNEGNRLLSFPPNLSSECSQGLPEKTSVF
jgi:hypothetical protein